ncbi:MAG TPA: flagellar basal body protein, partial [Acidimicrobiales bacterium]|nr:flagellar basal body protein [Acidimicrobiales bacterium]
AIANNLANLDTPGFTAQNVDFETSLQHAIDAPDGGTASVSVTADTAAPGLNGNNVDAANQLVKAQQATLQYQTMVELMNAQFRLIQGSAGGSWS